MRILFLVPPSKGVKNVARDLVYGCWCRGKRIGGITFPPVSLLTVATVLRKAGHTVALVDAPAIQASLVVLKKKIKNFDFVVVLTSTASVNEDAQVLTELKKANRKLKTIVFGGHPTAMPKETLSKPGVDIIVRREAEFVLRDLINAFEKRQNWQAIKGIGFEKDGQLVVNELYPLIEDLDILPIPDRSLLPKKSEYFNPVVKRLPYTTIFTSRGCPGQCIFCASPVFYGQKVRAQSAERVLREMEEIKKLGYKEVFIRDENFTVSKERVKAICEGILRRDLGLSWICSSRIDAVDKELLLLMKKAGCHLIRFGVESGDQKILSEIKKGIKPSLTQKVFAWAGEIGLDTHAHLMIGMPQETEKTIKKTICFAKKIKPSLATFGICTPFPGTKLFEQVANVYPEISDGSKADLRHLHTTAFYNHVFTKVSEEDLGRLLRLAYREFYFQPSLWWRWLVKMKSWEEFRRATLAATQVFDFILRGDEAKTVEREN